ncbi:MAG: enoyl-CoA hydratase/isomerase family protein [Thermoplasmata archaeon]
MADSPRGRLVREERHGPIAVLTLDSPPVNILSREVLDELDRALRAAAKDVSIHAVVLASALEKAFAAGASIREMAPLGPREARQHGQRGQALSRTIERLPLPVIAAVHGVCLGGGCEIALACDFIVASEEAQFGQPEIRLGVMPGWGGTRRLPRRIGAARARRWIYLGEPVSAREAERIGLVDRVVPREELLSAALALGGELARQPPVALAAAKYAVLAALDPGIDTGLRYELDLWARLFGTADQKVGMRAFLEKRPFTPQGREGFAENSRGFPWAAARPAHRAPRRSGRRKRARRSGRH